jgi:hypothetical protein
MSMTDLLHLWALGMFLTCVLSVFWLIDNNDKHK